MPRRACSAHGKPGYKWGHRGKCYTYTPGNKASRAAAKRKVSKQAAAIHASGGK